ncbi:ABC transporter ATP-binding protein [Streptomyces albidus (ex Kaewkla and Franco 2022)]|uniref:ABC transporter ATP-binding protein n=1 Tax=Streptomyces albidus (ex Kaewkla and Franco 2022) TaxID=722709 RepID=UPI0015EEE74D|nr:ATP-binding cassette domain-containing protein [Streptomyces albidus (ex Kaewkla and Franco 2022)]
MRLDGVCRRYGRTGPWVLSGVDLSLPEASLVRIEGTNGSGKSTLLRLLAGIDAPTEGRISGRPSSAFVPERFPAALPLTALGFLTYLGRVHGLRRTAAFKAGRDWLERFGAAAYGRTPLSELSKGTSQKVAVAQALMSRPGLLVLDEAWTGLDLPARSVLDRAVAERVADGGTVVFVDHDPRRLDGAPSAIYRVEGGKLFEFEGYATHEPGTAPAGPCVRIEAEGPPGAEPPSGLPGSPLAESIPDGSTLLTAPVPYCDPLLRSLLAANWHVRSVREEFLEESAGPAPETAPAESAEAASAVSPEEAVEAGEQAGEGSTVEAAVESGEPAPAESSEEPPEERVEITEQPAEKSREESGEATR